MYNIQFHEWNKSKRHVLELRYLYFQYPKYIILMFKIINVSIDFLPLLCVAVFVNDQCQFQIDDGNQTSLMNNVFT